MIVIFIYETKRNQQQQQRQQQHKTVYYSKIYDLFMHNNTQKLRLFRKHSHVNDWHQRKSCRNECLFDGNGNDW